MRIMVGYDGSEKAKKALKLAKKYAKAFDGKVYVLTSLVGGSKEKIADVKKENQKSENWCSALPPSM